MENDNIDFSQQSDTFDSVIGTNPNAGLSLSDVLQSSESDGNGGDSSSFTGIGDAGLDLAAPTVIGVSSSSDSTDFSSSDNDGGLLSGLL